MLWLGPVNTWIYFYTKGQVDIYSTTNCKLGYFLYHFFMAYPSTLLVILSIEKFIALYFPFRAKSICTLPAARRVSIATALLFIAFDSQYFYIVDLRNDNGVKYCHNVHAPQKYFSILLFTFTPIVHSFAPFIIMLLANFAIIYKFMAAKYKGGMTGKALSKSATRGTAMLLTVSFAFIILTGPIAFITVFRIIHPPYLPTCALLLEYVNHAINSVLYCISGSRFRNELKMTVFWWRTPTSKSTTRGSGKLNSSQTTSADNYI